MLTLPMRRVLRAIGTRVLDTRVLETRYFHPASVKALLRRGLVERVEITNEDDVQTSFWIETSPTPFIRLTKRGLLHATMLRLRRTQ